MPPAPGTNLDLIREAMARRLPVRLRLWGRSMLPTVADGARVVIRPLDGPPRPDDLLALARGGRLVVHRAARVDPDGSVVTRGDAAPAWDLPTPAGDVLGSVLPADGRAAWPRPPHLGLRARLRRALGLVSGALRRL